MKPIRRLFQLFLATVTLIGVTGAAALSQTTKETEFKPRVARISYIEGPVTTQRTTDEDWVDATLNLPLLVGDKLYTGIGGRAEVQLEDGIVLRLNGDTYFHFANLEDTMIRVGLLKGSLDVNATKVAYTRTPIEVQSKTFQAGIYEWGNVRFDADEAGYTVIMVKRGSVDIAKGEKDLLSLKRGQQARINAADPNDLIVEKIRQEDDFDQWCHMRDAILAASRSDQYVNPRVAGYSDLDRYGAWVEIPEYGRVWRPAVVVDTWAPYRDGRWVWRDYCGWTWISYEPWGWVPYHYGRWVYVNRYNWCWVPGPDVYVVHHRPYYYSRPLWWPALVSFSYSHHGRYYSFAFGSGGYYSDYPCVGWFPLGPLDPYPYYYHHHYGYTRIKYENNSTYIDNSVHIDNSTNYYDYSTHNYQNVNAPNAVTVMNKRDFDNGEFSKKAIASLNPSEIRNVTMGPEAAVQISPRRAVETKPERGAAGADVNSTALPAGTEPVNAARASQTGRDVSATRGNAADPNAGTTPAAVEPVRGQGSKAPRAEGSTGQSPTSVSPARAGTEQTGESLRAAQPGRDTSRVREEAKTANSSSPTPGKVSLSQRRTMTQDRGNAARKEMKPAATQESRATSPSRNANPATDTPAATRSLSPSRTDASTPANQPQAQPRSSATLSERRALIQDRGNAARSETTTPPAASPRTTSPSRNANPAADTPGAARSLSPSRTDASTPANQSPAQPRSSATLSERRALIQDRGNAVRSETTTPPATSPRATSPARGANPAADAPAAARSLSPSRTDASTPANQPQAEPRSSASLSERRALIQDRGNAARSETTTPPAASPRTTSPSREVGKPATSPSRSGTYTPNRTGTMNLQPRTDTSAPRSSSTSSYVPLSERRSLSSADRVASSQPNIVHQPSVRYLGPSRSSESAAPSYSAPRSARTDVQTSPKYTAPRTYTPSNTYSAPRTFSAPRSAPSYQPNTQPSYTPRASSAPSYSAPSYSAPRSVPRMSAPSVSAPRMSAPSVSAPRMSAPQVSVPRGSGSSFSAPREAQTQRFSSPRR